MAERLTDFETFWLMYLRDHRDPRTRAVHYAGTLLAITGIAACILLGKLWFLLVVPVASYGPAWIAHLLIEKNEPTARRYPVWSLAADFRMAFVWVTGQIEDDLKRAGIETNSR